MTVTYDPDLTERNMLAALREKTGKQVFVYFIWDEEDPEKRWLLRLWLPRAGDGSKMRWRYMVAESMFTACWHALEAVGVDPEPIVEEAFASTNADLEASRAARAARRNS